MNAKKVIKIKSLEAFFFFYIRSEPFFLLMILFYFSLQNYKKIPLQIVKLAAKRSPIFLCPTSYHKINKNNDFNQKHFIPTSIKLKSGSPASVNFQSGSPASTKLKSGSPASSHSSPQNPQTIFHCSYRRSDGGKNSFSFQSNYNHSATNEEPMPVVESPDDSLQTGEDEASLEDEGYQLRRDLENRIRLKKKNKTKNKNKILFFFKFQISVFSNFSGQNYFFEKIQHEKENFR